VIFNIMFLKPSYYLSFWQKSVCEAYFANTALTPDFQLPIHHLLKPFCRESQFVRALVLFFLICLAGISTLDVTEEFVVSIKINSGLGTRINLYWIGRCALRGPSRQRSAAAQLSTGMWLLHTVFH